jgi:hypothetical protein
MARYLNWAENMEEKIAAVLLFTESLLVNEYGAKDNLWDEDNNVEVEDLTKKSIILQNFNSGYSTLLPVSRERASKPLTI